MARRVAVAALLLPFLLLLAIPAAHAQTPKRGGVIRIAEREAPGLDPHLTISFLSHSYVSLAYSQLVRFPNGPEQKSPTDFSILPDLAEKWAVSKDGRVYTFSLRKGVKFHNKPPVNGREMVAEDVKYSLERFMAKSGFNTRFEPVSAIEVVDKHTVRITLKEPYAPFLNHLANPSFCVILPREAEEKYKDFNHPDAVIGTGPFVLKSYEKGVRVVFERNPDFYMKGFPYLDGAVIEITPDAAARVAVLRAGKADLPHIWGWVSPEEAKALQKTNPELVITPHQVIGQGFMYMRTDQPPFNDIKVRRAVSLAIDRTAWNEALLFGEGCIDAGPVPCALKDWKLDASKIDAAKAKYLTGYDPAEAKKLLAEAGLGKGFTTPIFHWPGYVVPWRSYYELAADNLGKIGITVELKPEEYGKYISTTALGKYEKMAMGPVDAVHRGRRLPVRPLLSRAAHQPEPGGRRRAVEDAGGPAARDGSQEAQADRGRHPALPGRQGLLRLRSAVAAVRRPPAGGEGLQAPRRLRARHAAGLHLAGSLVMSTTLTRRAFLAGGAAVAGATLLRPRLAGAAVADLDFASAVEAARAIRRGEVSSVELTTRLLDRIARLNPKINAIVTLTADDAMARAKAADEARSRQQWWGPLHGVPAHHQGHAGGGRGPHDGRRHAVREPSARAGCRRGGAPARGRGRDPRQDQRPDPGRRLAELQPDLRRDQQPVGCVADAGWLDGRAAPRRSPPGSPSWSRAATSPGRFVSPPTSAACTATSPRSASCRSAVIFRRRPASWRRRRSCRSSARSRAVPPISARPSRSWAARMTRTRARIAGRCRRPGPRG